MQLFAKLKSFFINLFRRTPAKVVEFPKPEPIVLEPSEPSKEQLQKGDFGIDVSHHNGKLDWKKIKESGVKFAFIKASDGASFKDPRFKENYLGAKAAGVLVGAYHYFRPDVVAHRQIDNFLFAIADCALDLPAVFDWEHPGGPMPGQLKIALDWLEAITTVTGKPPIIYTGPYFFRDVIKSPAWASKYPLWIAHYGTKTPKIPPPWTKCYIHQYTETGKLSKHAGQFDLNVIM